MLKIIGYRVLEDGVVIHRTRKRKMVKDMQSVKNFEYKTAIRYITKHKCLCVCWAIIEHQ
jgi:hypothetical protein